MTEERIKEMIGEIVAKSKDIREKPQKVVKNLKEEAARSDEVKIEEILKKLNIPTKEEINELNTKFYKLLKKLEKEGDKGERIQ